jgi:signal transduction histidine kinase
VNSETLNIKAIYDSIVEAISYLSGIEKVLLTADIDTSSVFVSDKLSIVTILSNLITNAVKYRRDNVESYVKFSFKVVGGIATIIVEDNGEGIPEDKFQQVFEMFYRNTNKTEGSGLGLYIVKQNVAKLNGKIELESKTGEGSKFTVTIPNMNTD